MGGKNDLKNDHFDLCVLGVCIVLDGNSFIHFFTWFNDTSKGSLRIALNV